MLGCLIQADADLETGHQSFETDLAGFPPPQGGPSAQKDETVRMFDNEIDWVMRIGRLFLVPAAVRRLEG
jgi:hypothetical protein